MTGVLPVIFVCEAKQRKTLETLYLKGLSGEAGI